MFEVIGLGVSFTVIHVGGHPSVQDANGRERVDSFSDFANGPSIFSSFLLSGDRILELKLAGSTSIATLSSGYRLRKGSCTPAPLVLKPVNSDWVLSLVFIVQLTVYVLRDSLVT